MRKTASLILYAAIGWAACGATVAAGRELLSMRATFLIHALIAPLSFGVLTWRYVVRFPQASAAVTALVMTGVVMALDALVVAPFFEGSYAMFGSPIGTWVPFVSILTVSYLVGHIVGRRARST